MKAPRFEIFKSDKDGQYYFRLRAKNGRIIFNSKGEGYTQKHNAEECIELLMSDDWMCQIFQSGDNQWYWVAASRNNETIGGNETYTTKSSARKGISSVERCAPIAEIVDLTKD